MGNETIYWDGLMSTFQNKYSLRTIEAEISKKIKNIEARPKFTGSYKKKACRRKSQSPALDFFRKYNTWHQITAG